MVQKTGELILFLHLMSQEEILGNKDQRLTVKMLGCMVADQLGL
jgi:hypothetical protein